jgi:hypothetical protein
MPPFPEESNWDKGRLQIELQGVFHPKVMYNNDSASKERYAEENRSPQ